MMADLNERWRTSDPLKYFYRNADAVAPNREQWKQTPDLAARLQFPSPHRFRVQAGRTEAALAEFKAFAKETAATGMKPPPAVQAQPLLFCALCHLRLGEQENCLHNRDGTFDDVTKEAGLDTLLHTMGCNFGDIDNDGDQDIYSVVGGVVDGDHYPNQLFAHPGHRNRSVKLMVEGVTSNRSAIGARLAVMVAGPDGERTLHRTVGTGGSFSSAPLRQEIGLGAATRIVRVAIFWPVTGATQVITGLELDRCYVLREGEQEAREVIVESFALPTGAGAAGHQHHGH